jgi:hypothetical protein
MNSPTILPLAKKGWSSLHSVIGEPILGRDYELKMLTREPREFSRSKKMIV